MHIWKAVFAAAGLLTVGVAFLLAQQLRVGSIWPSYAAPAASATSVPVSTYPALTRQHFMNSCITSGGTQSSCACAIDGIQAHYSLQEFAAFDARATSGEKMPVELVRIVSTCNAAAAR